MKVKAPPRMSSIQWFVSIAAGPGYVLLPQDAQSYFPMFTARFCGRGCLRHSACPLLLFKLYEPIGVAMLSSMFLTVITFAIRIGIRIYEGPSMEDFTMAVNVYDGVSWGMVWSMPLLCCFLMRILPREIGANRRRKGTLLFFPEGFRGIRMLPADFAAGDFSLFPSMNFSGMRQLNLVPFLRSYVIFRRFEREIPMG